MSNQCGELSDTPASSTFLDANGQHAWLLKLSPEFAVVVDDGLGAVGVKKHANRLVHSMHLTWVGAHRKKKPHMNRSAACNPILWAGGCRLAVTAWASRARPTRTYGIAAGGTGCCPLPTCALCDSSKKQFGWQVLPTSSSRACTHRLDEAMTY